MQLSYYEIWNGLDELAKAKNLSLSALAQKAGLDPTSFNKSKRIGADGRKRWPSTESMNKVLKATNTTVFEFMEFAGQSLPSTSVRHTIPLLGLAKAGREGYFDANGYPLATDEWDGIDFPVEIAKGVYALEVSGDSMQPVYREGDKLIVQPDSEIRVNDRVVVKLKTEEVMVKELKHRSAKKIELKSLNPQHDLITLSPDEICWMARVIWVSQ